MKYCASDPDKEAYISYIKNAKVDYKNLCEYYSEHPEKKYATSMPAKYILLVILLDIIVLAALVVGGMVKISIFLFAACILGSSILLITSMALIWDSIHTYKKNKKR